uniref:TLDc domain-containing protein n=1 Tax=Oryzias melastigma TaxID=30732 RepID=A0A3B3D0Y3_ORYME
MNSRLTKEQQKEICSELGNVKLSLLYKATSHGFKGEDFHQHCDNKSPTVSVGYNSSGYVFGGYTSQPFSQSGDWVKDDQAFLFCFTPLTSPLLIFLTSCSTTVTSSTLCSLSFSSFINSSKYSFHLSITPLTPVTTLPFLSLITLTCCMSFPSRSLCLASLDFLLMSFILCRKRNELMESIKSYKPLNTSVPQAQVLLVGGVRAGKSSFFNSINSVFRGHVTSQAISGTSSTILTLTISKFRSRSVKAGREGEPLPILICDTMGLEKVQESGCHIDDIISIVNGHIPDRYQFNPSDPLQPEAHGFCENPELKDKIHCVAYVIDASKISIMPHEMEDKLKIRVLYPWLLVLLTQVDEACPLVKKDIRNVYKSKYIKDLMEEASTRVGVPLSCIVPVKNYSEELELDTNTDILLLTAAVQILRFVDNYIDEISDQLRSLST